MTLAPIPTHVLVTPAALTRVITKALRADPTVGVAVDIGETRANGTIARFAVVSLYRSGDPRGDAAIARREKTS